METALLKARVAERVEARAGALDELAIRIHERPELAFEERFASSALADHLAREGATVMRAAGGLETAFAAEVGSGTPVVAILGEYDALPGIGHACGHNLMGTAANLAFLALRDVAPDLRGRVRVVGCPAEERGNGKVKLIRAGLFSDVDAALMYHPGDRDEIDPLMLAMVTLEIEFIGKAAHAAAEPYEGRNALDAVMLAWTALSALRLTVRSDSRFHGIVTDGGKAANIIPDRAAATYMVRSPDNGYLHDLRRRVLACFEGAAAATGCELRATWSDVCELVSTNRPLAEAFAANAKTLGRQLKPRRAGDTHGSTDMGNVTSIVPGIHPFLSITDGPVPGHSVEFAAAARTPQALETMHVAAKALAMTAIDVLRDENLRLRAKEAFDGKRH
ncbi:MAG TPA: M20 family metallopeptidase [Candidatus Limnocylindria bacterium]|jgi:amidohydrolase|nr:M20 family metallopeptidase [Candidatus Limnocylindria bacterium]